MNVDGLIYPPMLVDVFEPEEIIPLLRQSIPVERDNLNTKGYADYFWNACDLHTIQVERKQNGELLGSLDAVESQLRRQYGAADENILLVEGFIIPAPQGCATIKRSKDGRFFIIDRTWDCSYSGLISWFYQLDKSGITLYNSASLQSSAAILAALYRNSLKPEHTTLTRYIKSKIYLEDHNPHVLSLMGIEGANLGEKRAKALIDKFGTLWEVLSREESELCQVEGIGPGLARGLLKSIGR